MKNDNYVIIITSVDYWVKEKFNVNVRIYEKKEYLIWLDLEMTGLNPDIDAILEIATAITDNQLNIIAEGPGSYYSSTTSCA